MKKHACTISFEVGEPITTSMSVTGDGETREAAQAAAEALLPQEAAQSYLFYTFGVEE